MTTAVPIILNSADAVLHLRPVIRFDIEEFWILVLSNDGRLLRKQCLFRGSRNKCRIDLKKIFRFATCSRAQSIVVIHSHPNRQCFPSEQDLAVTQKMLIAAKLFGICIADHLILTKTSHFSFADRFWLRSNGFVEL